ncbi:amino acid permease [Streptomyces sp900105245]|uniref:Amino acid permease n=1 Tax=Streptomyces sp. 900105245 TaxID=3154379 RepID=A0ABV1ULF3_9ACTN
MGYPRKLTRRFQAFDNFAISFSIINVLSGIFSSLGFGLNAGGPRLLVFGWIGVSLMVLAVGAAMGEVASAYPTSGALYFAAGKLAKRHKGAWSWYTGWLNFVGQVGGTAATGYAAATFCQALLVLQWPSYVPTMQQTVLITVVIIVSQGVINTCSARIIAVLNRISVWWLLIGLVVIVGALAIIPDDHRSPSFATEFVNTTGFSSGLYGGMLGLLVGTWTFTGFDGSFHMSEETVRATVNAPKGITRAIVYSAIGGLMLILALVYSIGDYGKVAGSSAPPVQILIDGLGIKMAKLLLVIVIGAMLFCGLANLTSNTRQIFAFSRDGAMPGSHLWHSVSLRTRTPVKAAWLAVSCSLVLVIPAWWSHTAFTAIVSINVVGLFLAYAVPIFLRLRLGADFSPGPWNLGRWGIPVGVVAISWIVLSSVLFMLPQASPASIDTFNYAPIALLVVLAVATFWWLATARRRFKGPVSYGCPQEVAAMDVV